MGTIMFVGDINPCPYKDIELYEHPYDDEQWVGVELDVPVGRHDGVAKNGRRYFQCRPGHGLFVRPEMVDLHLNQLNTDVTMSPLGSPIRVYT